MFSTVVLHLPAVHPSPLPHQIISVEILCSSPKQRISEGRQQTEQFTSVTTRAAESLFFCFPKQDRQLIPKSLKISWSEIKRLYHSLWQVIPEVQLGQLLYFYDSTCNIYCWHLKIPQLFAPAWKLQTCQIKAFLALLKCCTCPALLSKAIPLNGSI